MNRNDSTHRGVCGEWSGVDLLLLENQDRTPLKVAITGAIMFHLILFWWNIWPQGKPLPIPPVKDRPFVIRKYVPKQREPEKKPIQEEKAIKVPIPDRTPHEIEPVFEFVADLEPPPLADSGVASDDNFEIPVAAPPAVSAPIRDYMAISPPVVLERVEPQYPSLAKIVGVEGLVILEAVIQKDGSVGQITVLKTPPGKLGFDREAVSALRQWKFRPGEMHGRRVDVIMTLTVKFRLNR